MMVHFGENLHKTKKAYAKIRKQYFLWKPKIKLGILKVTECLCASVGMQNCAVTVKNIMVLSEMWRIELSHLQQPHAWPHTQESNPESEDTTANPVHSHQKAEAVQRSTSGWMCKQM